MKCFSTNILICLFLTSCSHTYYVVRHAEKAVPSAGITLSTPNDPPLSVKGELRANDLKEELKDKKIAYLYATNTVRTRSTAEPLRIYEGLNVQTYGPKPDSAFIGQLKRLKRNALIVGHSNTVDDIVNGLSGRVEVPGDLPDTEFDNLFVIRYRKWLGTKITYERKKFGEASQSAR
ncbi:histidine phosphatase family protein [Paraflavitalea pollutisoli]|uniref:histidine phosphatase family protein n=1 Tax=Paraflavitalea pollutisoli TaxID=3034143 RepID=UPI0023EBFD2E|nr:histidine phosphatase family protein [Paraflavitalea sp. H1-2-19X]